MKVRPLAMMFAGWLVPGLGHLLQRKYVRAGVFFFSLAAMTALGLALGGRVYPVYLEPPQNAVQIVANLFKKENPLTVLAFFSDLGNGLFYVAARLLNIGAGYLERATFEFGTAFLAGAGLLNFLVAIDAYDIAAGKKS